MLVEFAGCSGAGKSALYGRVRALLRSQRIEAFSPLEFLLGRRLATPRRINSIGQPGAGDGFNRMDPPCPSTLRVLLEPCAGADRPPRRIASRTLATAA